MHCLRHRLRARRAIGRRRSQGAPDRPLACLGGPYTAGGSSADRRGAGGHPRDGPPLAHQPRRPHRVGRTRAPPGRAGLRHRHGDARPMLRRSAAAVLTWAGVEGSAETRSHTGPTKRVARAASMMTPRRNPPCIGRAPDRDASTPAATVMTSMPGCRTALRAPDAPGLAQPGRTPRHLHAFVWTVLAGRRYAGVLLKRPLLQVRYRRSPRAWFSRPLCSFCGIG